jgi:hypothetical protein
MKRIETNIHEASDPHSYNIAELLTGLICTCDLCGRWQRFALSAPKGIAEGSGWDYCDGKDICPVCRGTKKPDTAHPDPIITELLRRRHEIDRRLAELEVEMAGLWGQIGKLCEADPSLTKELADQLIARSRG